MKEEKFYIYLKAKTTFKKNTYVKRKKYRADDDYRFVIADICHLLHSLDCTEFIIEGFPELTNLSCDFDLMCALEELPKIFNNIKENNFNFEILLYEQGTEKEIRFRSSAVDDVEIFLYDLFGNCIEPIVLKISKKELVMMLTKLHSDFLHMSYNVCPHLINNHLMTDFVESTNGLSLAY